MNNIKLIFLKSRLNYRVWDNVSKKYYYLRVGFGDNGYDSAFIINPVFEQCTGLEDVRDYLIFEGDVLIDRNGDKFVVYWYDGALYYGKDANKRMELNTYTINKNHMRIVGNIHESKDF